MSLLDQKKKKTCVLIKGENKHFVKLPYVAFNINNLFLNLHKKKKKQEDKLTNHIFLVFWRDLLPFSHKSISEFEH